MTAPEEVIAKRRATIKITVKLSDSACSCEDNCDCVPPLYLLKNGRTGYGQAIWTYHDDRAKGLMYWCEFLGLVGFWATDMVDAADKLRERLHWAAEMVDVRSSI